LDREIPTDKKVEIYREKIFDFSIAFDCYDFGIMQLRCARTDDRLGYRRDNHGSEECLDLKFGNHNIINRYNHRARYNYYEGSRKQHKTV
jgi:hypothetical protein